MIIISSDSTADLGELTKTYQIPIMPLRVILDRETYTDGVDILPETIFDFVEKTKILPKTAAPSIEDFRSFFKKLTEDGSEVIHFTISDKASSSYSCALVASKEFEGKVHVVDSKALSSGQGLLVMKAVDLRQEGKSAEEIVNAVETLRDKVNTSFIPDKLDYLYKGGRCSKLELYGANILKIHPVIAMQDGSLHVKKKYRGKMDVCVRQYAKDLKEEYAKYDKKRCFITHSGADKECVELAKNLVKELFDFEEIVVTQAGSVVSGHCGKNTIGILFIGE